MANILLNLKIITGSWFSILGGGDVVAKKEIKYSGIKTMGQCGLIKGHQCRSLGWSQDLRLLVFYIVISRLGPGASRGCFLSVLGLRL